MTASPDDDKTNRAFPPGRIAALVLIGLAVLGLMWLRFGPDDELLAVLEPLATA